MSTSASMAQGKPKQKVKLPAGVKPKQKYKGKKTVTRKGARDIAPKKSKHIEATLMKKGLERAINARIEKEASQQASSMEPKSMHVVK